MNDFFIIPCAICKREVKITKVDVHRRIELNNFSFGYTCSICGNSVEDDGYPGDEIPESLKEDARNRWKIYLEKCEQNHRPNR